MNLKERISSIKKGNNISLIEEKYMNIFLQEIEEMRNMNVPNDYINFLLNIGCGEIEFYLNINSELLPYYDIFDKDDDKHLEGMYFFASDLGEYLFAFDSKNNWQIVEIDSDGEIFQVVAKTFTEFINNKLDELIEIEESE